MIKILIGDLFESSAQTLVNTVNCVGVMGKGIALEFKKRFPEMYNDYVNRCNKGEVKLGRPYLYRQVVGKWGIKSIAVPPLGCGYGQLEWRVVGPTIYRYMKQLEIPVELYAPHDAIPQELKPDFFSQKKRNSKQSQKRVLQKQD